MPSSKTKQSLPDSQKAGVLVKTSLVDYPSMVACTVFLRGCNLRCPYCYNIPLVKGGSDQDFVTTDEIKAHLLKRKNVIKGLVISGGEALLSPHLKELILFARRNGYSIKLDTNGTLPDKLSELLADEQLCPDYIAMDIKTTPEKYKSLLNPVSKDFSPENIIRSIRMLSELPPEKREFRTVLVPTLIKEDDIKSIAALLPEDASWFFARFLNKNCLEPLYNSLPPYTDDQTEQLVSSAKKLIPGASLR